MSVGRRTALLFTGGPSLAGVPSHLVLRLVLAAAIAASPTLAAAADAFSRLSRLAQSAAGPGQVSVRFMGTSTILVEADGAQVLVDGFFSRPTLGEMLSPTMPPKTGVIGQALARAGIEKPKLKAILVAHAHHDHAMDSAWIAHQLGAVLVGSDSVRHVANGQGFAGKIHFQEIQGGQTIEVPVRAGIGREAIQFRITAYCSPHSATWFSLKPLTQDLPKNAGALAYTAGPNYSYLIEYKGVRLLVHPSGGYRPGLYRGLRVDVLFLGLARTGRLFHAGETEAYWREVVEETQPSLVIPIHWDDFTKPINDPLPPLTWPVDNADLGLRRILALNAKLPVPYDIERMPIWSPVALPLKPRIHPAVPPVMVGC